MLAGFFWCVIFYRKRWLLGLSVLNLVLIAVEAWLGSIVVATNLVPWTITVHLFLALVILLIQLYLVYRISPKQGTPIRVNKATFYLWWAVFGITFYQMFLGTQVREYIDALTKQGLGREAWSNPNPFVDFINVEGDFCSSLKIIDALGNVLLVPSTLNQGNRMFDTRGLPSGMYFLRYQYQNVDRVEKLIKH